MFSTPQRRTALFLALATVLPFAALTGLSAIALKRYGLSRTGEDRTVVQLQHTREQNVTALVLSDSVSRSAFARLAPGDGIAAFEMVGYLRLPGQYFLARRFLAQNHVKRLFLFTVPEGFWTPINDEQGGRIRYTYTDALFQEPAERAMLRAAGDTRPFWKSAYYDVLLRAWAERLRPLGFPERAERAPFVPQVPALHDAPADHRNNLAWRQKDFIGKVPHPQVTWFLDRLSELCREYGTECTLVVEPVPETLPRHPYREWAARHPGLRFVDMNEFARFPEAAFADGTHLTPAWSRYYAALVNQKVMSLYRTPSAWDGQRVAFASGDRVIAVADAFPAEAWGRWTGAAETSLWFAPGGQARQQKSLELEVRALIPPGRTAQRLSATLNGKPLGVATLPRNWDIERIHLPLAGGSLDCDPCQLTLAVDYLTRPNELDRNTPDQRPLGIGLVSMSLAAD